MMLVDSAVCTCCVAGCGIPFEVPSWWKKKRQEDHTTFYCPNGHPQSFRAESEEEKMRRERDIAKQQLARAEDERRAAERKAEKALKETKRLKKRAAAGTCPCCSRTVIQMARHMKTKHPDFVAKETTNVVPIKKVVK